MLATHLGGRVGQLAYSGRFGLAVVPVSYKLDEGSLVFRITLGSPTDEDLRTGIQRAEYGVAIEIDDVGQDARDGWFVFIQGATHHLDSDDDGTSVAVARVQSSADGTREISRASRLLTAAHREGEGRIAVIRGQD